MIILVLLTWMEQREFKLSRKNCQSILRPILEEWYNKTGCPMLLNTSLNIKGQPIVNDENDAIKFMERSGIHVF